MKKCDLEVLKIIQNTNLGQPVGIHTINNRLSNDCFEELIVQSRRSLRETVVDLLEGGYIINCGNLNGFCITEKGKNQL